MVCILYLLIILLLLIILSPHMCNLSFLNVDKNICLEKLYCGDNGIKSLDLANNTELSWLDCSGNLLTELDLRNNTGLEHVECRSNGLTNIILDNPKLTYLDCQFNQMERLDLNSEAALIQLYCSQNGLMSLDIRKNTAIERLDCTYNKIGELNLSHNPNLKYLYCDSNKLTVLDLRSNKSLYFISCCGNLLTELYIPDNLSVGTDDHNQIVPSLIDCSGNKLVKLDLGINPAIYSLHCQFNGIKSINISGCPYLVNAFRNEEEINYDDDSRTAEYCYEDHIENYYFENEDVYDRRDIYAVLMTDIDTTVICDSAPTITPTPTPTPSTPSKPAPTVQPTEETKPTSPKMANPLTVKAKNPSVKSSKLKKKAQIIKASKAFKISGAQGTVSYKKPGGSKKLSISSDGKITVKKGTKKGTYKIVVVITSAGNDKYEKGAATVTVSIKVK